MQCVRLHERDTAAALNDTILVSGPSRSGTSLVAAALKGSGLWMGDRLDTACFEDIAIASAIEQRVGWIDRVRETARDPTLWNLARKGMPLGALKTLIARRDRAFPRWGFKRPNILPRLGREGLALFRHPRVILCFRDPVALAQRAAKAEDIDIAEALHNARRLLDTNLAIAASLSVPTLLVSFEKLTQDRQAGLREIFDFCRLDVGKADEPRINTFIDQAGCEYKRLAAGPIAGFVDRPMGPVLSGWCRPPKTRAPATIDIFADGVKLATAVADRERPDLRIAGFTSLRHGFAVDLRPHGLRGTERIDILVSGTAMRLEDSGLTLGQLRMPRSA